MTYAVQKLIPLGTACATRGLRTSPGKDVNRWSGVKVGLAHLGAPYFPLKVGLATLLLASLPSGSRLYLVKHECRKQQQVAHFEIVPFVSCSYNPEEDNGKANKV